MRLFCCIESDGEPPNRTKPKRANPPEHLKGKHLVGASSSDFHALKWGYKPKPDSAKQRTVFIDLATLKAPGFTNALWALEPGKPELVKDVFEQYENAAGVVLVHTIADWCAPNLLLLAYTLRPEAWANLERSIRGQTV